MLKIFNKILIRIKRAWPSLKKVKKVANLEGLFKNPLFFFGFISVFLLSAIYVSSGSQADNFINTRVISFNSLSDKLGNINGDSLFSSKATAIPLETPDLKIMQDNTLCGVATPCVVSGKVLGDVFGGNNQNQKDVVNYVVQPGDTMKSISDAYKISVNTLLWANSLTSSSTIKVGQSLVILPTDGVLHVVKSGDTISGIAQTYKAQSDSIISYNDLSNQDDIYIGDILIVPGGVMPKKASSTINNQIPLANNFFIFPTEGTVTQRLHYFNGVDVGNKCGTPVYAAAAGTVQRAVTSGWNEGMGNYITILHSNGTVTYYAHLMAIMPGIASGVSVYTGQNIALMGGKPGMQGAGDSTGCHLHFAVVGAKNFLSVYSVGAHIGYK